MSVNVPAGNYLVTAETGLGNRNATPNLVRCFLFANNNQVAEPVDPEVDLLPADASRARYSFHLTIHRDVNMAGTRLAGSAT